MKTRATLPEPDLLDFAVSALRESSGVAVRVLKREVPTPDRKSRVDAKVQINEHTFLVEIKGIIDRVDALRNAQVQLHRLAGSYGYAPNDTLLVTSHLTTNLIDACRELKLNAVDGSGNAHLAWDKTLILVSGLPRKTPSEARLGWTSNAVRLALIALYCPEALNSPQRSIAASAGISLGSVGSTLKWLESRRFLVHRAKGIAVARRDELLNEWSVAYPARLRPRLHPQRFTVPGGPPKWTKVDIAPGQWSGEVAASIHHGNLRPATAELYVDPAARRDVVRRLVRDFHLRPDPVGSFHGIRPVLDIRHRKAQRDRAGASYLRRSAPGRRPTDYRSGNKDQERRQCPLTPATSKSWATWRMLARKSASNGCSLARWARDLHLVDAAGIDASRATNDVDIAAAVESWEIFASLKELLIGSQKFVASNNVQRLLGVDDLRGRQLDIVPFGEGIRDANNLIR